MTFFKLAEWAAANADYDADIPPYWHAKMVPDAFTAAGGILWSISYILMARKAFKDKSYAMPIHCLCLNITWEAVYGFVYGPGLVNQIVFAQWVIVDMVLFYAIVKSAPHQWPNSPLVAKNLTWIILAGCVFCMLLLGLAHAAGHINRVYRSAAFARTCQGAFDGDLVEEDESSRQGPLLYPSLETCIRFPKAEFITSEFTQWAQEFGEIFSLKLGPATAIVISSPRAVKELIDRKSSIYSNRPPSYVSHDLITRGEHLLVMEQGSKWKLFRKLLHQQFNEGRCERDHIALQDAEAVQMLRDFCVLPEQFMSHPKRFSNSIIMSLILGIRSPTPQTPHLVELYELMDEWSKVMETGATPPVDIFPFLKWVPESLFGNWITRSRSVGKAMDTLYGRMVSRVLKRREALGSKGSFLDGVLDQNESLNLTRDQLNFLCGVLMEGGSDTSSSIILAFMHAMIKYPEVQKRAQMEIDGVVGADCSPRWEHYAQLPYVAMTVKETMRWRPVTPLAFPHATSEADTIDGMTIPKGATVLINVWGLHHDPTRFPNPDTFNPTRFQGRTALAAEYAASADYQNRDHYGYGSGRRICPGIHLADRNLFLAMAKLLWAFSFSPKLDANGNPIEIDVDSKTGYSEGFLHCPKPFQASIVPRSEERVQTIFRELEKAEREVFSKFESG
ncbi:hypothetical protein G7Y89_g1536 [Cudoniella acicularis]|uniref:Cytochrome P450 n=1 Tax=Cudoniella acicularis TaxID=354080 RepID=A0A8H4RX23_9HELO|nr:hypothetical protein G7Y89_g1536 [Cudoniella acicularis]